jgi:signal peptidase I
VSELNANDTPVEADKRPRGGRTRRKPSGPLQSFVWFVRDVVIILVIAVAVSFVVKTFFVRSFYIPSC